MQSKSALRSPIVAWSNSAVMLLSKSAMRSVNGWLPPRSLAQLTGYDTKVRATLDCTSGWYSHQDWTGLPLAELLHRNGNAQSLYVHSVTGYWVRFPIHDMDRAVVFRYRLLKPPILGND